MEKNLNILNKLLLGITLMLIIGLLYQLVQWFPQVAESKKRLNVAQCLESYDNQGQPPLGACGFDFD